MVGEGHAGEHLAVDVAIEGRPAAVAVLHGLQPAQAALHGGNRAVGLVPGVAAARQTHQHHGGVVDVRVVAIMVLEEPAGRFQVGVTQAPVARPAHLALDEPARGLGDGCLVPRRPGQRQGVERQSRIPDRREAGLHAERVFFLDHQVIELLQRPDHLRRLVRHAEAAQTDDGVNDGRENGADAVAIGEVLAHPRGRALHGTLPDDLRAPILQPLDDLVDGQEEVGEGEEPFARRVRPERLVLCFEKQLGNCSFAGRVANRLVPAVRKCSMAQR